MRVDQLLLQVLHLRRHHVGRDAAKLLTIVLVAGSVSIAFTPDDPESSAGCLLLALSLSGSGSDTLLNWDEHPEAQGYCVERGDLGVLRATGGDFTVSIRQELASNTSETSLFFSGTPERGEAYWFLVKDSPAGTFDSGCPSQVDSRDDEILGAGDICVN